MNQFLSCTRLAPAALLGLLAVSLSAPPIQAATVGTREFHTFYSATHGTDVIGFHCTANYTTLGVQGRWILTEVVTTTTATGALQTHLPIAIGKYQSGDDSNMTRYLNGSVDAVRCAGPGVQCSYHYELVNQVWDAATKAPIVTSVVTTSEQSVL